MQGRAGDGGAGRVDDGRQPTVRAIGGGNRHRDGRARRGLPLGVHSGVLEGRIDCKEDGTAQHARRVGRGRREARRRVGEAKEHSLQVGEGALDNVCEKQRLLLRLRRPLLLHQGDGCCCCGGGGGCHVCLRMVWDVQTEAEAKESPRQTYLKASPKKDPARAVNKRRGAQHHTAAAAWVGRWNGRGRRARLRAMARRR